MATRKPPLLQITPTIFQAKVSSSRAPANGSGRGKMKRSNTKEDEGGGGGTRHTRCHLIGRSSVLLSVAGFFPPPDRRDRFSLLIIKKYFLLSQLYSVTRCLHLKVNGLFVFLRLVIAS